MNYPNHHMARGMAFIILLAAGGALFSGSIMSLLTVSSNRELYSHIPLIPIVSLYFCFIQRKDIFSEVKWGALWGLLIIGVAFMAHRLGGPLEGHLSRHNHLSFMLWGLFVWVLGGFLLCYGARAFKGALFPLLFLVFIIPIPTPLLDPFVRFLQLGAAEFTHLIFKVTGVTFHRDGILFFLPGLTIEVAPQCSGIRSSIALVVTGVVAGKMFLEKGWERLILALSVFPITMFKNALRIVMLTLLAVYVDPRFITGSWLHSSGGIPFFLVALLFLLPVLWGIRKWEKSKRNDGIVE